MTNEEQQTDLERVLSALQCLIYELGHYVTGEDEHEKAALTHACQLYEEITGKPL